jgi:hypothetical protein
MLLLFLKNKKMGRKMGGGKKMLKTYTEAMKNQV